MAEPIKNRTVFDHAVQAFVNREYGNNINLLTRLITEDAGDTRDEAFHMTR